MFAETLDVVHSVLSWLPQTETWLYAQIRNLPGDIRSHVVCDKKENLEQFPIADLSCVDESAKWRIYWEDHILRRGIQRHSWLLSRVARNTKSKLLHSHFGDRGWADSGVARKRGMRHVVTFYGYDVNFLPNSAKWWRGRYDELFSSLDRVLCEGSHMAKCIVALGCPANRVTVHHLGVALEGLPFRPRRWNPERPLKVLIAGAFKEKKGIPFALQAVSYLAAHMRVEVTVIGDANPAAVGSLEEKRRIVDVLDGGAGRYTRLLGFQPHSRLLAEAYEHDVFLSPSVTASDGDTEGGAPVSIIEMAASGMPVVSTNHCDIPEVLQGSMERLLAPERDVNGLVDKLAWLVNNEDAWEPMLQETRRHIERTYDAAQQGEKLGSLYRKLAS